MKSSGQGTNGSGHLVNNSQLTTISERKLKANRENAKKSTGPKTPRGKAFSRRNAVKHGLFVSYITDFEALDEDPKEYQELLNGLWDQYQPIGKAEEIEIERIALCCWRLKRVWRYENAMNLAARRDFVRAELHEQEEYCRERDKEEEAVIAQLQSAKKEIDDTGHVSPELKQRIVAMMPQLKGLWSALDRHAQERMEETGVEKTCRPELRSWFRETYSVTNAIALVEQLAKRRWTNVMEIAIGRHAIPNPDALDRILRYETTVERYLSRALEQLERLQRRGRGELLPPSMMVQLT
jgi:hypothetical protein